MNLFKDTYQIIFSIQKILGIIYGFIKVGETKKALTIINLLQTHIDTLKINLPNEDSEVPKNFFKRISWALKMAKTFKEDWTYNIALVTSKLQTLSEMTIPEEASLSVIGESLDLASHQMIAGEVQLEKDVVINLRAGASLNTTLRGPCVIKQEVEEVKTTRKKRVANND